MTSPSSTNSEAEVDPQLRAIYAKPLYRNLRDDELFPCTHTFLRGGALEKIVEDDLDFECEEGADSGEDVIEIDYSDKEPTCAAATAAKDIFSCMIHESETAGFIQNIQMKPFEYEVEVVDTFMLFNHVNSLSGVLGFKNSLSKTSFTVKMKCDGNFSIHTLADDLKSLHQEGQPLRCTFNFSLISHEDDAYSVECNVIKA